MKKAALLALYLVCSILGAQAQSNDDLSTLFSDDQNEQNAPVTATFKTTKLVNANTIEQVKRGELDFRIAHRFDDIAGSTGGISTLYGFDNVTDMRISFDYGITDRLCVGFARSKGAHYHRQLLDFSAKGKILEQRPTGMPVSVSAFGMATLTTMPSSSDSTDVTYFADKFSHRLTYTGQVVVARKFGPNFSLEVLPTYVHRNLVHYTDTNGLFALGVGGRYKFSKRMGVIFDYYQIFNRAHVKANGYVPPLGIGLEIDTGGHVFHLLFSNNKSLVESQYLTENKDSWAKGEVRFGFNISRIFNIVK
jgi:hypothetical protein